MRSRFLVCFAFVGLAIASAKTYSLNLMTPAVLGGTELQPGEYRLEVADQKAVIRAGKVEVQAAVKVETASAKYSRTSVLLAESGGKMRIAEICIGGTTTKLVLSQ